MKPRMDRHNILEARTHVLKAMAHPSRLLILQELAKGERCVCHLQDMIGADISTVSKHLALLKKAGLVEDERRGTWVFYRLVCPCLTTFLDCIDSVLTRRRGRERKQGACSLVR